MIKDSKAFEILSDIAWDLPKVANVRMASLLVIKNEIISVGSATSKSHPFQKKYGRHSDSIFLHSEVSAIHRALKRVSPEELSKSTLYICRVRQFNKEGNRKTYGWGLACPCIGCLRCILEFGIKRVVHTIDSETLRWKEL